MLLAYAKGIGTGAGLIIAIGAQNAFVLSQGIRKTHPLIIPAICALCDALLVAAGVTGTGRLVAGNPMVTDIAGLGGALFLFWYGTRAFYAAVRGGRLETEAARAMSLRAVVLATLGVTLLNPHVYIDTILLIGSIAGQFPAPDHLAFGAGAVTASFIWFFLLSLGAGFLAPLFSTSTAWRILDSFVGTIMWTIAFSLVRGVMAA